MDQIVNLLLKNFDNVGEPRTFIPPVIYDPAILPQIQSTLNTMKSVLSDFFKLMEQNKPKSALPIVTEPVAISRRDPRRDPRLLAAQYIFLSLFSVFFSPLRLLPSLSPFSTPFPLSPFFFFITPFHSPLLASVVLSIEY